jgi:hypothetical protein
MGQILPCWTPAETSQVAEMQPRSESTASERASERACVRARMTVAAILVADVLTIMEEVLVAVVGVIMSLTPSVRVWRAYLRSHFQPTLFMCAMFTHVHTAYSSHNRR